MNSKANKFQEMEKFIDMGAKNNYNNSRGGVTKNQYPANGALNDANRKRVSNIYDTIGDGAKECIENGLNDAEYYIKNINNYVDKDAVRNASVKLALAKGTDNEKMQGIAFNELNTLLATEKPSITLPLSKYLNEKDNFDYKTGRYSTTKYISDKPDESVAAIQHQLNKKGYTDKFNNVLKEDGLLGARTIQAMQKAESEGISVVPDNLTQIIKDSESASIVPMPIVEENESYPNLYANSANNVSAAGKPNSTGFYDNTRLSKSQRHDLNVEVLQQKLVDLGYLSVPDGEWGFYGEKTENAVNRYKENNKIYNKDKDKGVVGKCTWEHMGLPYLTKDDISSGLSMKIVNRRAYYDVSACVNKALNGAVKSFKDHENDYIWFANMVKGGAYWDIKLAGNWENVIKCKYPGSSGTTVYFYGKLVTPEALGNITYGYLGTAAGFTKTELLAGGDAAAGGFDFSPQGIVNGIRGYLKKADSEEDKKNIIYGIDWYNRVYKNKKGVSA